MADEEKEEKELRDRILAAKALENQEKARILKE